MNLYFTAISILIFPSCFKSETAENKLPNFQENEDSSTTLHSRPLRTTILYILGNNRKPKSYRQMTLIGFMSAMKKFQHPDSKSESI